MLRKYCLETEKCWYEGIPYILFEAHESVQESLGFSLAELVFVHTVCGPRKVLKDKFLFSELSPETNVLDFTSQFWERFHHVYSLTKKALASSQTIMKGHY